MNNREMKAKTITNRRRFLQQALGVSSTMALAPLLTPDVSAQGNSFANPPEIAHQKGLLQGVIRLGDYVRTVPNLSSGTRLRTFQGWDLSKNVAAAAPPSAAVAPGPTLRARVGGKVNIMFLNAVDDARFTYSMNTAEGNQYGCDASTSSGVYPATDIWPNCFHGSSTANLHFHGTHTDPDGLGDNVLVQVIPDKNTKQSDWAATFGQIFKMAQPPQSWAQMPEAYQKKQLGYTAKDIKAAQQAGKTLTRAGLVGQYDDAEAAKAKKDNRPAPSSLWDWDVAQVATDQWPQYIVGGFPNVLSLPEYKPGGPFKMGQAPGTHWYHAHKHGSTSLHIFNGLAGAMVIEGDYDDKIRGFFQKQLPSGRKFTERVMVFQQITAIQNLQRTGGDNPGTGNNQKLINGKLNPIIAMEPGEIQLWRFVNAMGGGNKGTLLQSLFDDMKAQGFDVRQVAADGVQFHWDNYVAQPFLSGKVPGGLTLAAGNRADLLVKAPTTAKTARLLVPADTGGQAPKNQTLFVVQVAAGGTPIKEMQMFGSGDEAAYPKFPDFLDNLPPQTTVASTLAFGWGVTDSAGNTTQNKPRGTPPNPPPHFTINGKQFGENSATADQCMPLGDVQDWVLTNSTGMAHPFHIHINPFQIVSITTGGSTPVTYTPTGRLIWQDVIAIPPGGSVRIRHRFADFVGTYVLHCHILAHEDRGMMQLVRVVKPENFPAGCKLDHVGHH
jgi:FtsP/CotA-like multicopper oxidase with cupredoxin domain